MLFMTRCPLRCGRNNPKYARRTERAARERPIGATEILSAPKPYLGDESVVTLLRGTEQRGDEWFVVEREDNLDEVIRRTIAGPFKTEQEAERVAGRPDAAPEMAGLPDDLADLIAAKWDAAKAA